MTELTKEELALVRAGLDEDERVAKAAEAGPWKTERNWPTEGLQIVTDHAPVVAIGVEGDGGVCDDVDGEHIARHDPSRVLRDIGVWRQILTDYEKEARVMEQGHRTGWTEGGQAVREAVLRGLALSYAEPTDA